MKKLSSAPGRDGIDFEVIYKLLIPWKLLLVDIYNEMYLENKFPESWKEAYVYFIPKSDGVNFRPISLTSCLCKLFETMVKNRLQWWLEHENLLSADQSGFRKGRSCLDNGSQLVLDIDTAFSEIKHVLAAFLDVKGAFDNINPRAMANKMADLGCPTNLVNFALFLTQHRLVYSELNVDTPREIFKGVPQGGVLSL